MTLTVNSTSTISTDQFDPAADAIQYGAADIQVTIGAGVFVGSGADDGIESTQNGSTLINNGNVFGTDHGVEFYGDNATIINNAGRSIAGRNLGVDVSGDGVTITNHGTVTSYQGFSVLFRGDSDNVVLNNDGTIYGQSFGVIPNSDFDGGTINNSGLIDSDGFGVCVAPASGLMTIINNAAGGTIKGTTDAIETTSGRVSLDNRGTIAGDIDCNANTGNVKDTIVNRGKVTGDVFLGDGNDTFNGKGGGTSGDVFGEAGDDTLIGGKKNDTLNGGDGLDTIRGGRGKDMLFGGADDDSFDFNSVKDSVRGGKRDKIMDLVRGDDEIDLKGIDAKTGVGGNNKLHWIGKHDFHDVKGELRYEDKGAKVIVQGDVDGDSHADFEILVKVGALSAGDFVL